MGAEVGPTATCCVEDVRREFYACLRFAQGQAAATDDIEHHVRAFLTAASKLEHMFSSMDGDANDAGSEASALQAEVAAMKQELCEKELQLSEHRGRLLRWKQACLSLQLVEPMTYPGISLQNSRAGISVQNSGGVMDESDAH